MKEHPGHLPQLRLPESTYFVTWRLDDRSDRLSAEERTIVADALKHFHQIRYRLAAYVVMDDHVHVLLRPLEPYDLGQILHSIKSFTAKEINKLRGTTGTRWMKDSRTDIVRNERELHARANYILRNPVARWPDVADYPWVEWFDVF